MEKRPVPPEIVEIFDDVRSLENLRNAAMSMAADYGAAMVKRQREAWDKVYDLYPEWDWEVGRKPLTYDGNTKTVQIKDEPKDEKPQIPDL